MILPPLVFPGSTVSPLHVGSQSTNFDNKLECLSLASLSRVVCLHARPEATRVKHISGVSRQDRLLALSHKHQTRLEKFARDNTLAYYENSETSAVKGFIT